MPLSIYQATIPVLVRGLNNLSAILDKAEAHAAARNIDPAVFTNGRLAPDMYPLTRQIQIAADMAKGCAARLAGLEIPRYEDNEQTFGELRARIEKTVAFLQSVTPAQMEGSEEKQVTIRLRNRELHMQGQPYVFNFVLPNFHFHMTTAYGILRHLGVELGKADFTGSLMDDLSRR
jgi:hypothetical protein